MHPTTTYRSSLAGGLLAAIGATACCFFPLALVAAGLGGAWIASLRVLEPLQPIFAGVMLLCLCVAFYTLYIRPKRCGPEDVCAAPQVLRRQRLVFWLVVAFIIAMGVVYAIYNEAYL